jgi:hypothetical protein
MYLRIHELISTLCFLLHIHWIHVHDIQGAKFQYLDEPSADIKAACVCFRRDLWYHVGFSAIRKDDCNAQRFFAELRFDPRSDMLIIETCTILGNSLVLLLM